MVRPGALGRPVVVQVPCVAAELRFAHRLRARSGELHDRVLDRQCFAQRAGHTNDGLYVCGARISNGDTDTYVQLADGAERRGRRRRRISPARRGLNPRAAWTRRFRAHPSADPASGANLPFPPPSTAIPTEADKSVGWSRIASTPGRTTMCCTTPATSASWTSPVPVPESGQPDAERGCRPATTSTCRRTAWSTCRASRALRRTRTTRRAWSRCNGDATVNGTLAGQHRSWPRTTSSSRTTCCTTSTERHRRAGPDREQRRRHLPPGQQQRRRPSRIAHRPDRRRRDPGARPLVLRAELDQGVLLGNLTINGVITQEYRGAVGHFSGSPRWSRPATTSSTRTTHG